MRTHGRRDPAESLQLRLLGGAEFSDARRPELDAVLAQPKTLGLLVFLALAPPPRFRRRDTIAALFWPEQDQSHARGALRSALHILRDALGADVLMSRGVEEVAIDDTRLGTDVAAFDAAMAAGRWSEALGLYRGDLLEGYYVPAASPDIDQWFDQERQRLRRGARDAAGRLADYEASLGNAAHAVEFAKRASALAPDDEPNLRRLLRLLNEMGDLVGANRTYQDFAGRTASEFGAAPSPETQALIASIRARTTPRSRSSAQHLQAAVDALAAAEPARTPGPVVPAAEVATTSTGAQPMSFALPVGGRVAVVGVVLMVTIWLAGRVWGDGDRVRVASPVPAHLALLPLRVATGDSLLDQRLRDQLAVLLAARVNADGAIAAVDPDAALAAWRRETSGGEGDVARALRAGRAIGSTEVMLGDVVVDHSSLRVTVTLLSVTDGRVIRQLEASGRTDSVPELADRLGTALLGAINREPEYRVPSLQAAEPAALSAYFAGRRAYRGASYDSAVAMFSRALALDSSFAVAAISLADAAIMRFRIRPLAEGAIGGWPGEVEPTWAEGTEAAWRARRRLSWEDSLYLATVRGAAVPGSSTVLQQLAAWEGVIARVPDRADAWFHFGNLLLHAGPAVEVPDSWARAGAALSRAATLDSSYVAPLVDLLDLAGLASDTVGVRQQASRILAIAPTGGPAGYARWRLAAASPSGSALAAFRTRFDSLSTLSLQRIVWASQVEGLLVDDAVRAAGILQRRSATWLDGGMAASREVMLALNRGRPLQADSIFDGAGDIWRRPYWGDRFKLLYAVYWGGDGTAAAAVAARIVQGRASPTNHPDEPADRFVLEQSRLLAGDTAGASGLLRELREMARSAVDPGDQGWGRTRADVVEVLLAAALDRPNLRGLLDRLDSLVILLAPGYSDPTNLLLARLYERVGDRARALRAIRRAAWYFMPEYLSTALVEEGRLAALTSDTVTAVRAYRHYLALRDDPEPAVQPEVDRVRAELQKLEGVRH